MLVNISIVYYAEKRYEDYKNMKQNVFISHSSQNAWLVDDLMKLIFAVNPDVYIFCSSDESSIDPGQNFKDTIYKNLKNADVFIAIISREYWKSKYCAFELGAAYERYCDDDVASILIQPMLLPPLNKGQALADTPLVEMQLADLTSSKSVTEVLRHFTEDKNDPTIARLNVAIAKFCTMIHESILRKASLYDGVEAGAYFDERGRLPVPRDRIAKCRNAGDSFEFTFNLSLLEYDDPSFASVALVYWENLNLREYLSFDSDAAFCFTADNRDGVLNKLTVEFKSAENNRVFVNETIVGAGKNEIRIPLKNMNYKPLECIREICFVIHPTDMNCLAGEVVFSNIRIDFKTTSSIGKMESD